MQLEKAGNSATCHTTDELSENKPVQKDKYSPTSLTQGAWSGQTQSKHDRGCPGQAEFNGCSCGVSRRKFWRSLPNNMSDT